MNYLNKLDSAFQKLPEAIFDQIIEAENLAVGRNQLETLDLDEKSMTSIDQVMSVNEKISAPEDLKPIVLVESGPHLEGRQFKIYPRTSLFVKG